MIDVSTFPIVPAGTVRTLPHDGSLDKDEITLVQSLGWKTMDVRLLPSDTMEQRQRAVLAWLEGVRLGSVIAETGQAKVIDLEMRCCGLYVGKLLNPDDSTAAKLSEDKETLEDILRLGTKQL